MPRTPPRTHPARPLTISECVRHGKEKRKAEALGWLLFVEPSPRSAAFRSDIEYSIPMQIHPRMAWIYRVDQGRHLPTAASNRQRWGGVGWQDRWRHGPEACLGRVGQDAQPRPCRVRRTAHTSKAPSSPQG
ncbi:hypothetical protein EKL94_07850 [Stenotrophomonas maltophilia]|uniref:Uncharacterized protein n=1 Tax=Stenotrophomonas maltophilia TaxID=40324 RepID=A0A431UKU9_STEMA|nr:hypothetical protein EKL94_07850 [Stenotrophomonas maltophilia]